MSDKLFIARAALHYWEEPCISGQRGSGAVFFSGCSLKCVYCQNYTIANAQSGRSVTADRLAEIFFELRDSGACNINLVTGTHFIPHIVRAIDIARQNGFELPFVYNTSAYETVENIRRLNGYIDVYLPDYKYYLSETAKRYSNAPDYPEIAEKAIAEMLSQVHTPVFDSDGLIKKGVIVRHLVLPGNIKESKLALNRLRKLFGNDIYVSIMKQYTPMSHLKKMGTFKELEEKLSEKDYKSVVDFAVRSGITNAYVQYGDNAKESFIPEFDGTGV